MNKQINFSELSLEEIAREILSNNFELFDFDVWREYIEDNKLSDASYSQYYLGGRRAEYTSEEITFVFNQLKQDFAEVIVREDPYFGIVKNMDTNIFIEAFKLIKFKCWRNNDLFYVDVYYTNNEDKNILCASERWEMNWNKEFFMGEILNKKMSVFDMESLSPFIIVSTMLTLDFFLEDWELTF